MKKQMLLITLLSITIYGESPQIDPKRIHECKESIAKRVHRNWFLKGGIYTTGALITACAIYYNYFKVPDFSPDQIAKALDIQLTNQVKQANISKSFLQKVISVGSEIARALGSGFSFVAQNVVLTIAADSALHRSMRVITFPGNLTWFIEHQTYLNELLQDYTGYATLLQNALSGLRSEVDRAYESVTTQLPDIIEAVEKVLGYMEYVHPKLREAAQKEAGTTREYLIHTTEEFASAVSEAEPNYAHLASKVQQFVTEVKSLCHRFARLQHRRYL